MIGVDQMQARNVCEDGEGPSRRSPRVLCKYCVGNLQRQKGLLSFPVLLASFPLPLSITLCLSSTRATRGGPLWSVEKGVSPSFLPLLSPSLAFFFWSLSVYRANNSRLGE